MNTLRSMIEQAKPRQRVLLKQYKEWTKEIKKRCLARGFSYPPFAVFDRYHEAIGSNGLVMAIHHSSSDATVYNQTVFPRDERGQPVAVDPESYRRSLRTERWDLPNTTIMFFPMNDIVSFEPLWVEYVTEMERQKKVLEALRSPDVLTHLREASRLVESSSNTDWGNAKAQARKALESLALGVTGTSTTLKGLGRELESRGLLGKRETEWIDRFDNLLGSTYALGSKKGGHKPDPTHSEAVFYVRITDAIIDYVISLLLAEVG